MRRLETAEDVEKALSRLMPVALSDHISGEIEDEIDALSGGAVVQSSKSIRWKAIAGVAAVVSLGILVFVAEHGSGTERVAVANPQAEDGISEMIFLTETDRVEDVEDEGLFVDAGGSAVRQVRVRVVEESQIRDEETGIVVMLTEPREELYMVPISNF